MTLGCLPLGNYQPQLLPVNTAADEMEIIIRIMATQSSEGGEICATALKKYYLSRRADDRTQKNAAKDMDLSLPMFRFYFKGAYSWLAGWFTHVHVKGLLEQKYFKYLK